MTVHMQFGVCQAQCDQLLEVNVAQTFQAVAQKLVTKKCKNHTGQARIG